jgi:hypothetical protein
VEDVPQLCQVLWGLYYFHVVRAELHTVREVSGELLTLAQHLQTAQHHAHVGLFGIRCATACRSTR